MEAIRLALRIPVRQLRRYQRRYDYAADPTLAHIRVAATAKGFITVAQLHEIVLWKSPRRAKLAKSNSEEFVREITTLAFSAKLETSRIGGLVLLQGVQHPTASAILHFCVDDSYPILDFRALWSLGIRQPASYTTDFWIQYVQVCRSLAKKHAMSVRELDMALWQYSKEHQRDG